MDRATVNASLLFNMQSGFRAAVNVVAGGGGVAALHLLEKQNTGDNMSVRQT
jgi:hypothetical protein